MNIFKNRRKLAQYDRARRAILARWMMTQTFSKHPTEFDRGAAYAYARAVELIAKELAS